MSNFTPISAAIGGGLIGLSARLLMLHASFKCSFPVGDTPLPTQAYTDFLQHNPAVRSCDSSNMM